MIHYDANNPNKPDGSGGVIVENAFEYNTLSRHSVLQLGNESLPDLVKGWKEVANNSHAARKIQRSSEDTEIPTELPRRRI